MGGSTVDDEKRERRKLKKAVKKAGNKHRRAQLKRDLHDRPEEAAHSDENLGRHQSEQFNGLDHDTTRRKADQKADGQDAD